MANNLEKQREIRYEFFFGNPVYLPLIHDPTGGSGEWKQLKENTLCIQSNFYLTTKK